MVQTDFELFSEVDEDGFVALVCPGAYLGYVDEDWSPGQITQRFLEQMNAHALFIAHPGPDFASEPLRISNLPSPITASREASSVMQVDAGGLWLTDYTQLTMAAQFTEERPIAGHHTRLPVPAGTYRVTIRQFAALPTIELLIQAAEISDRHVAFGAIPWVG